MLITLTDTNGKPFATSLVKRDAYGDLVLAEEHPTFNFEFECALYGYLEGGVSTDTIDDDDGKPYIVWVIEESPDPNDLIEDFRDYCHACEDAGTQPDGAPFMADWFESGLAYWLNLESFERRSVCYMARILGKLDDVVELIAEDCVQKGLEHAAWLLSVDKIDPDTDWYLAIQDAISSALKDYLNDEF